MMTGMSGSRRYLLPVAVLWQFLAMVLFASQAHAAPTNIAATLVAEGPAGPGQTVTLSIHMEPGAGWHGYWLNPGDAGLGMQLDWKLPQGASVGEAEYPVPDTLVVSGLMNHVYKGDYAVLVPLHVPAGAKPGTILPIAVDAQWLACTDEICVPEQALLETRVQVGPAGPPDPRFDRWRMRLPSPLGADTRFAIAGNVLRLAIPLPASTALTQPHVFIADDRVAAYAAPQRFSRNGNVLVVELQRPATAARTPDTIAAVLRLDRQGTGLSFTASPGRVPPAGKPLAPSDKEQPSAGLPLLLLGALVGGLLLNVMPCVFPILSLKALSLARAGESEAHARIEGLAYAAGVIAASLALGAILLALRAAGEEVGWAFQLQEPAVIALLLLLAVAITANFLGLFEFAVPGFAGEGSTRGAFATGLLAAFVATPCTGPFMAAAMGAALLLPIVPALSLFAALGLGLALPFLIVAFVPAVRRRLPRPGPWMNRFRRWMALPMGLTAAALLWLASRVAGFDFAFASAELAAVLVVVLIWTGRRQRRGKSAFVQTAVGLALVALAAFAILPALAGKPRPAQHSPIGALAFSEHALDTARASGKPVFVWMTADWCITCKVNEQVAIEREATLAAFKQADVVVLRGDWTRRDPAITRYLTAHGAAGVPFYMWYPAGNGTPRQLPQVLTSGMLTDLTRSNASAAEPQR